MLERREAELREAMKLRHSLTSLLHALRRDMEQVFIWRVLPGVWTKPTFVPIDLSHLFLSKSLSALEGSKDETHYVDKRLDQTEQALGDHVTGGVMQSWRQVQRRLGTFIFEGKKKYVTLYFF